MTGPFSLDPGLFMHKDGPVPRKKSVAPAPKISPPAIAGEASLLPTKVTGPKVLEILEREGFCPITELIKIFRDNKQTFVTKDGTVLEVDISPSDRIAVLKTLTEYVHSKPKQQEAKGVGDIKVIINTFGNQPTVQLEAEKLPAPRVELL